MARKCNLLHRGNADYDLGNQAAKLRGKCDSPLTPVFISGEKALGKQLPRITIEPLALEKKKPKIAWVIAGRMVIRWEALHKEK